MKAIMVMFDSLNRHMLQPYGCDWTHTPNFQRLSERAVTFDNCYVGSLPCMPARRELHTGRYNFLHRSWGPIEPFDNSMPEILKRNGVYTHLVSDHTHYWEDGGATYHTRYSSWDISRGQEGDPWKGVVTDFELPEHLCTYEGYRKKLFRQDCINRKYMQQEEEHPQAKTFNKGMEFIRTNAKEDNWFLQIESFDPHEPYFSYEKYKKLYEHNYDGPLFDWPNYQPVQETSEQVKHCKFEYAALLSMCDNYLGKVLDLMDELDLWKDTMLIVNTDHGFLLGEHGLWAKNYMPFYNEISNIPLFIWDPRCKSQGVRCDSLVQTIDLAPTLLDFFSVNIPKDMQGTVLKETLSDGISAREALLFGMHGASMNCTDGRYAYMRAPVKEDNQPLYEYTLMPTHMERLFSVEELQGTTLAEPFSFTKGCSILKIMANAGTGCRKWGNLLFDLKSDPKQLHPIKNDAVEKNMIDHMIRLMKESDAPKEQYERLGL